MYLSRMRYLFILLTYCCITGITAQSNNYAKELSTQIDNDAFLLKIRDGYYSSGLYLRYATANTTKKGSKRIQTIELGQQMYTPRNKAYAYNNIIDRPYAGYLYAKYAQKTILPKAQQLEWSGALGVVGPAAGAAEFQEWYHNLMNYAFFPGWEKQIPNQLALDASLQYSAAIQPAKNGLARIYPTAQINLGTTFSNLRVGSYFVLGKAESLHQSALFQNRIQQKASKWLHKEELFVYYYPSIVWQWYNATIQGAMGNKPGAPVVTASPSRLLPEHRFGFCYAKNRSTIRVEVVHQGKEATSQTNNQNYGVIGFAYRFQRAQ